jgi:ABC-type sugar transport system substrate-binding protein
MTSSSPRRKSWLSLLAIGLGVLALSLFLAACGGGDSSTSSGSSEPAESTESGGEEEAGTEEEASEEEGGEEEGASSGGEEGESVEGKTVSLVTCEPNVYCHAYNENLKSILGEAGVKVTQLSDNFEPELQNQHMDQAIAAKPDLIAVFASNADAIVPALARAKAAGIPTANLDARLNDEGEEYVDFEIVADNAALGKFAAENLIEGMEKAGYKEGKIIVVTGTMGTLIVEDRMKAFEEVMAEHPEFEVTEPQDGNWDPVESSKLALQLFTKYRSQGGVQGAYGMADYMAGGIIQAANQLGIKTGDKPGDTIVTASNCTPTGIPLMEKGELWGNATQSPIVESELAAERIIEFLEGKEVPQNTTVEEERFTMENYKKFIPQCAKWPS